MPKTEFSCKVSIPQAVSTVATMRKVIVTVMAVVGFNTASGKYCCNTKDIVMLSILALRTVSIPQAVSTVATYERNS